MSLDPISLRMIAPHLKGADILCLGYPEMAMPVQTVEEILKLRVVDLIKSPDPNKIPNGYAETIAALKAAGANSVDCVDVIAHRKIERVLNLNDPQVWPRLYDLVINPGTLEHCFNLGIAWLNTWNAAKVMGRIMHIMPATMFNHGFWNICPIALTDWCAANGGIVESIRFAENGTGREVTPQRLRSESGRGALPEETVLYAMCVKHQNGTFVWPQQGVYRL